MRRAIKALFYTATLLYPIFVFSFLIILKVPLRLFSLVIILFALIYFLIATSQKEKRKNFRLFAGTAILTGIGVLCFITNSSIFFKLYPVLINLVLLGSFGYTLFYPPVMIFRFALLQDKSIKGSLAEKQIEAYCLNVTLIWCAFFLVNGAIALFTALFAKDIVWSVYNGFISYIFIGILFTGEFAVRKMVEKKMPKSIPLSSITSSSRSLDTVICYDQLYSNKKYKTWKDFISETEILRNIISRYNYKEWILHCEDSWFFLIAFTALLQSKKHILLTANIATEYIKEIRSNAIGFLTDQNIEDTLNIPSLLSKIADNVSSVNKKNKMPKIAADETVIIMYTSGSTGKPKAVRQRLTEFEIDNSFVISKWGGEFLKRKLCSTVSQHHIYGLLFSILLPFTAGVPFRRTLITQPEEFENLTDDSYMIITVPAFLKRSVEVETKENLNLKSPWIFTSGGALLPEIAKKTAEIFGFWPVEVYGSTETSGIAYRQSKDGIEWTPFDNANISKNSEGCLVVKSPYIKDPEGFETGDIADILDDGRFILKGRADSIVKIEEKRISLSEVENRIMQSGFVNEVCVIPLSDRRQYLAAALVLNNNGKEKFHNSEKYLINRFFQEYLLNFFENIVVPKKWRYLDKLPADLQGKKKKLEIEALFIQKNFHGIPHENILEKSDYSLLLELDIPGNSEYFDNHFPNYKLLPGVAQFELITRLASRYFGTGIYVPNAKRIKFSNAIMPDSQIHLKLDCSKDKQSVSFKITSPDRTVTYSSGTLYVGEIS